MSINKFLLAATLCGTLDLLLPPSPIVEAFSVMTSASSAISSGSSAVFRFTSKLRMSDSFGEEPPPVPPTAVERLEEMKRSLVRECERVSPDKDKVLGLVQDVEDMGEQVGVGQGTAVSGLMAGQWSLIYASEDVTRSSPFFWAFRKTFPQNAEEIFSITDAIPAPFKEVGPATQAISEKDQTLVSRVKVATLGGVATSIMTTRCTVLGPEGLDVLRVRVDTTKPEESTVLEKLGPLGRFLDDNVARPFPSGEALEKVKTGGSEVRIKTSFCDEGLRISRDGDLLDGDFYVWVRDTFESGTDI